MAFTEHHQGIADLQADGQPVKIATRLSIHDILKLRKWANSRRLVALPEGQMTGAIRSVRFKVSSRGMSMAVVEYLQEK